VEHSDGTGLPKSWCIFTVCANRQCGTPSGTLVWYNQKIRMQTNLTVQEFICVCVCVVHSKLAIAVGQHKWLVQHTQGEMIPSKV
jgi:hypothetical protein